MPPKMPKPATLDSEERLGYGLRPDAALCNVDVIRHGRLGFEGGDPTSGARTSGACISTWLPKITVYFSRGASAWS